MRLNKEYEEKIEKYISGSASPNDREIVEALFSAGESNVPLKRFLEEEWAKSTENNSAGDRDLQPVLDRIHHRIALGKFHKETTVIKRISRIYARVAAIILLPLLIAGGYLLLREKGRNADQPVLSTIYAPPGSRVSFTLPDGSTGKLNSGSSLTYSNPFQRKRDVTLAGEAWFEVAPDRKHPFKVTAGNSVLTVIGTSFNVNAYTDEKYIEVVLEKGSLKFTCGINDEGIILRPSERLVYENGKVCRTETDPSKYSSWTEGKLVFRGDSMSEVARRLERWYNIRVELTDTELENYSFRGTFEDDSLEEVLKFLCMTSPLGFELTPRITMPDGTYSKKIVRIYRK